MKAKDVNTDRVVMFKEGQKVLVSNPSGYGSVSKYVGMKGKVIKEGNMPRVEFKGGLVCSFFNDELEKTR